MPAISDFASYIYHDLCEHTSLNSLQVNTTDLGSINYFYWFFESRKNPSSDPLLLWLTGGPGCSGEIGLLMENGPFVINGTTEPVLNPYGKICAKLYAKEHGVFSSLYHCLGWNSVANILYVDQPGGTGFTYFTNPVRNYAHAWSNQEYISS